MNDLSIKLFEINNEFSKQNEINEKLFLITQFDLIVCGAIVQSLGNKTAYIESLDTSGYFSPRANQKNVVYSLVRYILDQDFGIFCVFSHPKKN